MGRKRGGERESYWRGVLSRQQSSGQSIATFCREQGVSPPSFYAWRRRLAERAAPQFVALNLPAAAASEFEVRLPNGASVVVPGHFDDVALARLLQLVAQVEPGDA